MISLTIEGQALDVLKDATGTAVIRDPRGKVVGLFYPARDYPGRTRPLTTDEGKAVTTRELFEFLKSITNDPGDIANLDRHIEELSREDR
jgi:hypothetical protein